MNNLVPFKFETSEIRIVVADGEPWFVGKDIAAALGYTDAAQAIKQHCKRHKPLNLLNSVNLTESLSPKLLMIQEPDVYRLIVKSTLPAAERFEAWVFEEVIPSIRKTGGYQKPNLVESRQQACSVIKVELEVAKIFNVPEHIAQIEAVKHANTLTGVDYGHLLAHAPAQNQIVYEEEMLEPKDLGERFGISAQKINKILAQEGYQLKGKASWLPTSLGEKFCTKHAWRRGFKSGYNLKWRVSLLDRLLQVVDTEEAA